MHELGIKPYVSKEVARLFSNSQFMSIKSHASKEVARVFSPHKTGASHEITC